MLKSEQLLINLKSGEKIKNSTGVIINGYEGDQDVSFKERDYIIQVPPNGAWQVQNHKAVVNIIKHHGINDWKPVGPQCEVCGQELEIVDMDQVEKVIYFSCPEEEKQANDKQHENFSLNLKTDAIPVVENVDVTWYVTSFRGLFFAWDDASPSTDVSTFYNMADAVQHHRDGFEAAELPEECWVYNN